jgi:hypothetical protein
MIRKSSASSCFKFVPVNSMQLWVSVVMNTLVPTCDIVL